MKLSILCGLLLSACVVPAAPASSTTTAPATDEPTAASEGVGCLQMLACYSSCDTDAACFESCSASGSPEAQSRMAAMLECTTTTCNNDADCATVSCSAELSACQADDRGAGTAVAVAEPSTELYVAPSGARQPVSNAGLLEWLVGDWIGNNHQFTFQADGRVRRASGVALYTDRGVNAGRYDCVSLVNDEGIATVEGNLLIMRFDTTDVNHCGDKGTVEAVTVRYEIQWYDNVYDESPDLQLILHDLDCPEGQSMYCDDGLNRR